MIPTLTLLGLRTRESTGTPSMNAPFGVKCHGHVVPSSSSSIASSGTGLIFNFIECFTTNFLRAHSWLNWVDEDDDEDEVGLKEKPEDTRYITNITSK